MSIFETLEKLQPSEIRRMFNLAAGRKDVISFGIGEPDFNTPANIREGAKRALDKGFTHYTPNEGILELREEISKKMRRENGINCDTDNVIVAVGATEGLFLALSSFLKKGDEVLIPAPSFLTYKPCVTLAGGIFKEIPCKEDRNFHIDAEDLRKSISEKTRAIILASPNNPTGSALEKKEVREIADVALENDLIVISDEVYEHFIYDKRKSVSIGSFNEMKDNTIIVNTFSKTYAMTGWRIGWCVANEKMIENMIKLQMYLCACTNSFAQYGAIEAWRGLQEDLKRMVSEYGRRREYVYKRMSEMEIIKTNKPEGTFYFFPSIKKSKMSSREFSKDLFEKEGLLSFPEPLLVMVTKDM